MKRTLTAILATVVLGSMNACTKAPASETDVRSASYSTTGQHGPTAMTRLTTPNNSQSIPLDTANLMLNSYLTSVGYPYVDTAVRSLSIDADTLRAYLQNNSIVTVKFMLAHNTSYIQNGHYGENDGLNPSAMTMIMVGLDDYEQYVLNSRNEVYDHVSPCPHHCQPGVSEAYIH